MGNVSAAAAEGARRATGAATEGPLRTAAKCMTGPGYHSSGEDMDLVEAAAEGFRDGGGSPAALDGAGRGVDPERAQGCLV